MREYSLTPNDYSRFFLNSLWHSLHYCNHFQIDFFYEMSYNNFMINALFFSAKNLDQLNLQHLPWQITKQLGRGQGTPIYTTSLLFTSLARGFSKAIADDKTRLSKLRLMMKRTIGVWRKRSLTSFGLQPNDTDTQLMKSYVMLFTVEPMYTQVKFMLGGITKRQTSTIVLTLYTLRVTSIQFLFTVTLLNHSLRSREKRKWSPT